MKPDPLCGGVAVVARASVARPVRLAVAVVAGGVGPAGPLALRPGPPPSVWIGDAPVVGNRDRRSATDAKPRRPPIGPPPSLREPTRVGAIGPRRPTANGIPSPPSSESDRDRFLARLLVAWHDEKGLGLVGHEGFQRIDLLATDDRGVRSEPWPYVGVGNGTSWRFGHASTPSPNPLAQQVRRTILALPWRRSAPQPGSPDHTRAEAGPWTLVVPLDHPSGAPVPGRPQGGRFPSNDGSWQSPGGKIGAAARSTNQPRRASPARAARCP